MTTRRAFCLGLGAALLPVRAFAQAPLVCPGTPATRLVKVHPRRATVASVPAEEVVRVLTGTADRRRLAAPLGSPADGAVYAEFVYELRLVLTSNDQPLRTCVVLSVAEVELHMEAHRIVLGPGTGSEGSCRRAAFVAHANRHAQVNLDCLDDAKTRIEQALTRALPQVKPVEGTTRNPAVVTRAYKRILTGPLETALDAAIAAAGEKHVALSAGPVLAGDLRRCQS